MRIDRASLRVDLREAEGDKGRPYDDATGTPLKPGDRLQGNLTVGVGHNLTAVPLSPYVRAMILDEDIDAVVADLQTFGWFERLDGVRARAIIEIRFNLGHAGFRTFHKMIAALDADDYDGAAWELLSSQWSTQVQPSRRDRLERMLKLGA